MVSSARVLLSPLAYFQGNAHRLVLVNGLFCTCRQGGRHPKLGCVTSRGPLRSLRRSSLRSAAAVAGVIVVSVVAGSGIGTNGTNASAVTAVVTLVPPTTAATSAANAVATEGVAVLGAVEERVTTTAPTTAVPTTTTALATTTSAAPAATTSTTTTSTSTTSTSTTSTVTPTTTVAAPLTNEQIGAEAEAILNYPWRDKFPGWTLVWDDARDGVRALTFPDRKVVEMYIRPGDDPAYLARVLAHEFGHVADLELNSDADRTVWREARGIADNVYWWPQGNSYDFDTGAGDFAEGFAALLVGSETKSRVGGPVTNDQLAVMADLVR